MPWRIRNRAARLDLLSASRLDLRRHYPPRISEMAAGCLHRGARAKVGGATETISWP
jgi:hypothetical protein